MRPLLHLLALLPVVAAACGTSDVRSVDGGGPAPTTVDGGATPAPSTPLSSCASTARLEAWQAEIDQFDGGFRPTGSPAHEGYIQRLASELSSLGVADVHTEPYTFRKWTPSSWSLTVAKPGPSSVALSGYVPYSGETAPGGVTAPLVYVAKEQVVLSPDAIASALASPATTTSSLANTIDQSLAALGGALLGKIVVFDVPRAALSARQLFGQTLYANDPGGTLPLGTTIDRADISAMLLTNAMLNALAAAGAVGAVGILDLPEDAARGLYAPFFGTTSPNIPAVYVERST
jgi:hypothetical protein